MRTRSLLAVLAVALLLAACGGGNGSADSASGGSAESHMEHDMGSMGGGDDSIDFGHPGKPGDAGRKIRVEALDSLDFDPAGVDVEQGETVTFVVTNEGKNRHEFILGDKDFQMAHEEEMAMHGMGGGDSNSVVVEPGETKEVTWTFTRAGEVLYGCHERGHYEGGMVGTVTVG